jgi:hypothetical protein
MLNHLQNPSESFTLQSRSFSGEPTPHPCFNEYQKQLQHHGVANDRVRPLQGRNGFPFARERSRANSQRLVSEKHVLSAAMSSEITAVTTDPIIEILAAFYYIPAKFHTDFFKDFQDAASSHDLRKLLDTISDWAATAELYAQPKLIADLKDAIGDRKEIADWLPG